jgi:glycosyltransferase involved in cell wall biosynthesis
MITPYVPYPPASGGQIRTLNLLKHLHKTHYVTLVALSKNPHDQTYIDNLREFCDEVHICERPAKPWQIKNILKWIVSTKPFLVVRNYSPQARRTVEELLNNDEYDVIHCETFYVMPHVPATDVPILLVEQTIELEVYKHFVDSRPFWMRPFLNIDIAKLRYWEAFYWRKAELVATVSEEDKQRVTFLEPSIIPIIVPNGAGADMLIEKLPTKTTKDPVLLFQGNFSWLQNIEAALYLINNIVPELIKTYPNMTLKIAGQQASKVPAHPNVQIIEIANDDVKTVKDLYLSSTLFFSSYFRTWWNEAENPSGHGVRFTSHFDHNWRHGTGCSKQHACLVGQYTN